MSTVGQAAGYLVGGIVGAFTPVGWIVGAQIGGMIGGYLDPPKGPKVEGPRLSDLAQQTASFGVALPRIYGACAVHGNVFWIENNALKEVSSTTESGGKGGGGQEVTEYAYFATFGLSLCDGEIAGIRRIWINGKLYYDAGSADLGTIYASNGAADGFTVYRGTEDQQPDPRMQATVGVANTPAYRGTAWILFEDLPLKDYGNTLVGAQIKVEVLQVATSGNQRVKYETPFVTPVNDVAFSPVAFYIGNDKIRYAAPQWGADYPATSSYRIYDVYPDGTQIETGNITCPGTAVPPNQCSASGIYLYSSAQVFASASAFSNVSGFISEAPRPAGGSLYAGLTGSPLSIHVSTGTPLSEISISGTSGDASIVTDGTYVYVSGTASTRKYEFDGSALNLIATGPGVTPQTIAAARLAIDAQTGQLCLMLGDGSGDFYKFASDLSSVSLFAGGQVAEYTGYYNGNFFVDGNIIIYGVGGTPVGSNDRLWSYYYYIGAIDYATVTLADIVQAETLLSGVLDASDIDVTSLTDTVAGYAISSVASIRAGLEPLQASWPFDVVPSGYKIKFARRGISSSVATIDAALLDARPAGHAPGVALKQAREMDLQLPWRVEINHIDFGRDYDIGAQYAERLNTDSLNITKLELAIVLTPDEAAQKAEILLNAYWLERTEFNFTLPPTYGHLEAADIITVVSATGSYVLRLTAMQYRPDGVIECTARFNDSAGYTSTAVGADSAAAPPSIIPYGGAVDYELLDLPVLKDAYDLPSYLTAMCGITSLWAGGNIYRSLDNGQNWAFANGFSTQSKIGFCKNAIAAPPTFSLMDKASVLNVQMYYGTLAGISELQMLNGANHFAYGADGRWEIIAAQNATLQADGTYNLFDLLRGRFGTEWSATTHIAGDKLVLLDESLLQLVAMNSGQIGLEYLYRGIPSGGDLAAAVNTEFAYRGVNLKPLSPVYASGSKDSSNNWTINWARRTRVGGELRDGVDATLGEASESYEVEICSSNNYTTVKRTLTGLASPTCTYTSAQQTSDFGSVQSQLYLKIYQVSATVGRGAPLSVPIPYKSSTLGLYHLDTLPFKNEVTGATYSPSGNGSLSTSTGVKFGSGAFYADSAGYASLGFASATALADFTFETWVSGQTNGPLLSGNLSVRSSAVYLNGTSITSWTTLGSQSLIHLAVTRKDGVVRVFWGGIQHGASGSYATEVDLSSLALGYYSGGPQYSYCYFDEVRLSETCLYTADFTPPSTSFTVPSGAW